MAGRKSPLQPIVAVPAKDEEQRLPLLLGALARQSWQVENDKPLDDVVVLNNCADATNAAALRAASGLPSLRLRLIEIDFPPALAHVGSARRLAMNEALARFGPSAHGAILTTDADAIPEPDWVAANLRALEGGADLVGGLLYGNRDEEAQFGPGFAARAAAVAAYAAHCDRLASLIDPHLHDPWPRHGDHTGGSLAITAKMYRAVGGLPTLPTGEDLALVGLVRAAGGRLVHPSSVRVEVSARLVGRAPGGMADCLKDWIRAEARSVPLLVEDPNAVRARLVRRKAIRDLCGGPAQDRRAILSRLGVDPELLTGDHIAGLSAAALVERFAADKAGALADTDASIATALILQMILDFEKRAGATHAA